MPRVTKGAARRQATKKLLKKVRGHRGAPGTRHHLAHTALMRAGRFAYAHRKLRKRDFRGLWIARLSAACRQRGMRYSQFIAGLVKANISLNRKMLSEIAIADPGMFDKLVETAAKAVA